MAGAQARRIAGICTGGFALVAAGLLHRRRATTYWSFARAMQERYPQIRVEEDRIFIVDGPVSSTAGLDLALGMVEKDLDMEVARSVAHRLVMQQFRSGGQT